MADDTETDTELHRRVSILSAFLSPFIPPVVIVAFALTPLLSYIDPFAFAGAAFWLSTALLMFGNSPSIKHKVGGITLLITASLIGTYAVMRLGWLITSTEATVERHERQCRALQIDMGRLQPRRANSAELFDALDCNPQNVGVIQFGAKPER